MIIVLETSVLGIAEKHHLARTGIYTYIRNLAVALHSSCAPIAVLPVCGVPSYAEQTRRACAELGLNTSLIEKQLGLLAYITPLLSSKAKPSVVHSPSPAVEPQRQTCGSKSYYLLQIFKQKLFHCFRGFLSRYIENRTHVAINKIATNAVNSSIVIHFPHRVYESLICSKMDLNSRLRYVATIHDLIPLLYPNYFPDAEVASFLEFLRDTSICDAIIAVSGTTASDYLSFKPLLKQRPVFVIPLAGQRDPLQINIVSKESVQSSFILSRLGISPKGYLLYVGTIEPRKNLPNLLRAFSRLSNPKPVKLVIVGAKGWEQSNIHSLLYDLGIAEAVILTGYIPDNDLVELYSNSYAFVYPSLYEGFGLPVLEAMSFGIPVVTSAGSSMAEIAGDQAIYVDPTSVESISQGIMRAVALQETQWLSISRALVERSECFSWTSTAQLTLSAYRSLFEVSKA